MENKTLSKQQIQGIISGAPTNVPTDSIIQGLVDRGYTLEGFNDKKEPNIGQAVVGGLLKGPAMLGQTAGTSALAAYDTFTKGGNFFDNYKDASKVYEKSGKMLGEKLFGEDTQPAQNAEELAGAALSTGAALMPGSTIPRMAASGAALLGGDTMMDNGSAMDVAKSAGVGAAFGAGIGAIPGAVGALKGLETKVLPSIEKIGNVAGGSISAAVKPENIMQRVLRVTKGQQAKFEQNYGTTIGQYAVDRGLVGTQEQIASKLAERFTASVKAADDALATLPGKYQPEPVATALKDLYQKKVATSAPGAMDRELPQVIELMQKYESVGLDMTEINQAKRLYERNVKLDFVKTNNPEGVKLANNIDSSIRAWQFEQAQRLGLKNLPEINKETRMAKDLLNSLEREMSGKSGNNAISLTDWIVLADGGAVNMAAFLAKRGFSSDAAQAFVAKYFAPKAKIGMPTAELGKAPIDVTVNSYWDFLKKTGAISPGVKKPAQQLLKQKRLQQSYNDVSLPQTEKITSVLKKNKTLVDPAVEEAKWYETLVAQEKGKFNDVPKELVEERRAELTKRLEDLQIEKDQREIMKQINQDAADSFDSLEIDTRAYANMRDNGVTDMTAHNQTDASGMKNKTLRNLEQMTSGKDIYIDEAMAEVDKVLKLRKKARESAGIRDAQDEIRLVKEELKALSDRKRRAPGKMGGQVDIEALAKTAAVLGVGVGSLKIAQNMPGSSARVFATPEQLNIQRKKEENIITGKGIVGGYDISKYATDPKHEDNIKKIYQGVSTKRDFKTIEGIQQTIKDNAPKSKITGKMIYEAAQKHGVDPKLVFAIIMQDSLLGTKGTGSKNNNPGNIMQYDHLKKPVKGYKTMSAGVEAVAAWLKKHKLSK